MEELTILVVDDEETIRNLLADLLGSSGARVRLAETAEEGLEFLRDTPFAVALVDLVLPGMGGIQLLGEIKGSSPDTEVVMMTSHASTETAVQAIRNGAYDYLDKPFEDLDEVVHTVRRASERRNLTLENRRLLRDLQGQNRQLKTTVERLTSLIDAGRAMSAIHSLEELLDYFIGLVVKELEAERASLMLIKEEGLLRIVAARGIRKEVCDTTRVKLGEGIAGRVAEMGKPLLVRNVKTDPRMQHHLAPDLSESFISAPVVLSIPIKLQEKVLGVINVTNRREDGVFDDEDMGFLYGLAGQAAVAIEVARQFDELKKTHESLKEAQDHLVTSERLKAMGQMAAGVAHDFNNLLNGILGRAQLLRARLARAELDAEAADLELKCVEDLAMQGADTVRRVQEFSRIRKDEAFGLVDLNEVVQNATEMTRTKWKDDCEARGVQLEMRTELGKVPPVSGNNSELTQVVNNLVFNAVEAMPDGGCLTLRTRHSDDRVHLEVADTGLGMNEEARERVFEPFYSTKENGQGLGTSIVYGIVARHRGEIAVSSVEGVGTRFEMTLPVCSEEPEQSGDRDDGPAHSVAPASVLVVDDGEDNREVFSALLEDLGHRAVVAATGREALDVLETGAIDLVLTDLSMPGMSGWQLAERVREQHPGLPVVLVSGWAVQQEEEQQRASGVCCVVQKPVTTRSFREAIEGALRSRSQVGSPRGTHGQPPQVGLSPDPRPTGIADL